MEEVYKLKTEIIGRGEGLSSEIRVLNKIVRMTDSGVELEADPRHAELVIKELGLEDAKAVNVPCAKEDSKAEVQNGKKLTKEEIRIAVEYGVDSLKTATESAGGKSWSDELDMKTETEDDSDDTPLDPARARTYRGVAARLNYITPDRADLGYAVKEAARAMATPRESSMRKLIKIGKYLIGAPRLVSKFEFQDMPSRLSAFTDSDWAGCNKTAKSTSGGVVCLGEHVLKTYCRRQKVVALSSAEAELYALVAASAETLALAAYAKDLGVELQCDLYCDSSAALGITQRAGIGKVRHLRTQGLWVQEVRVAGRIKYVKVLGAKNPADLLTKAMSAELSKQHLTTLNMSLVGGRSEIAPTLSSVESYVQGWHEEIIDHSDESKGNDIDRDEDEVDAQEEFAGTGARRWAAKRGSMFRRSVPRSELKLADKTVTFDRRVMVRPVPEEGKGRRTPARGAWSRLTRGVGRAYTADEISSIDEPEKPMCKCGVQGIPVFGRNLGWADYADDEECVA